MSHGSAGFEKIQIGIYTHRLSYSETKNMSIVFLILQAVGKMIIVKLA
jgi:hypothetical protein